MVWLRARLKGLTLENIGTRGRVCAFVSMRAMCRLVRKNIVLLIKPIGDAVIECMECKI